MRAGPARQREISLRRTSKACASRAGTSISQRMKSCCASLSSVSRFVPNECAGIVPSQRSSSASVSGSSGNVSPLSVKTNSFRSIRPFGWTRGASSTLVCGSALIAAAAPCAVQRSRNVSRCAMPGLRIKLERRRRSQIDRAPALWSKFTQANRSFRKLAADTRASGVHGPGLLVALRGAAADRASCTDDASWRTPAAAKTR